MVDSFSHFLLNNNFGAPDEKSRELAKKKNAKEKSKLEAEEEEQKRLEEIESEKLRKEREKAEKYRFSQEDIDEACQTAHAIGHAAGHEKAMESIDNKLVESLELIIPQIDEIVTQNLAETNKHFNAVMDIALAAAKKTVSEIYKKHGLDEVEKVIKECMEHVINEPRIVITVATDAIDVLDERIEKIKRKHGYEGLLIIHGDNEMPLGDCKIEWENGGLERSLENIWEDIDRIIDRNLP